MSPLCNSDHIFGQCDLLVFYTSIISKAFENIIIFRPSCNINEDFRFKVTPNSSSTKY